MPSSLISAGASLLGGAISAHASNKAGDAQANAAGQAAQVQKEMYDQTRQDLAPFRASGYAANDRLSYLLGLDTGKNSSAAQAASPYTPGYDHDAQIAAIARWRAAGSKGAPPKLTDFPLPKATSGPAAAQKADPAFGSLTKRFTLADYTADPGYQFRLDQGNKALAASQTAHGGFYSGAALKEADAYNSNQASQEYGNAYTRFNTDQGNLYSRLAGVTSTGMGATNNAVGANQNNANSMGNIYGQAGNAAANAAINKGNIYSQTLSSMMGGGQSSYNPISSFNPSAYSSGLPWSDQRLKHEISLLDNVEGVNLYSFKYLPELDPKQTIYTGVMAQEVRFTHPDAVYISDGMYRVDYTKLPVPFRRLH